MKLANHITVILAFLGLLLVSCNSHQRRIRLVIHNNHERPIDSVVVTTSTNSSRVSIGNIEPGFSREDFLDMSDEPYADGDYHVSIIAGTITYLNNIGYFTNGSPVEKKLEIWFSRDTIRYEFEQ